jgi:hypothetical protein
MTDNAIIPTAVTGGSFLAPAGSVQAFLVAYQTKKDFISKVLMQGTDFGPIPGSDKPALKKPGAEKLVHFFGLSVTFHDVETVEDWTGEQHTGEPFFYYRQRAELRRGPELIAAADGSCNSWEKKYRYRSSERVCPACGKATIIKGKAEYGGGFICFAKKGGCGAKFADNAPEIVNQEIGQVKNPDVAELTNTILKMSQKRALVAAVLIATNASDYFTQDIEDFIDGSYVDVPAPRVEPVPANDRVTAAALVAAGVEGIDNAPHAAAVIKKLALDGLTMPAAMERITLYKTWKALGVDKDAAAENAINGAPLP